MIERIAKSVGLSPEEIGTALSSPHHRAKIEADQQTALEIGVTGVPFFVIAGKVALSRAQPWEIFDEAPDRILLSKIEWMVAIRRSFVTLTVAESRGLDGGFGPSIDNYDNIRLPDPGDGLEARQRLRLGHCAAYPTPLE